MFLLAPRSLRASSQFGGDHEKWTRERHVRGDAKAGRGRISLAPRGFARSLARSRTACSARPNRRACLHAPHRLGRWRNVPSGEERGEKAVFAGHMSIACCKIRFFSGKRIKIFSSYLTRSRYFKRACNICQSHRALPICSASASLAHVTSPNVVEKPNDEEVKCQNFATVNIPATTPAYFQKVGQTL